MKVLLGRSVFYDLLPRMLEICDEMKNQTSKLKKGYDFIFVLSAIKALFSLLSILIPSLSQRERSM